MSNVARPKTDTAPDVRLGQLWPYFREHRLALSVVAVLSLVTAGTSLAQPLLVSRVISAVQDSRPAGGLAAFLAVILIVGAGLDAVQSFLLQRTAEGVVLSTRRVLAKRVFALPVVEYDQRRTGDLMSRIGTDTTLLRAVVTSGLIDIASSAVLVIGAAVAMALIDLVLLGVTLVAVALGALVITLASPRIRALSRLTQVRVGEMTSAVERSLSAVRTIRASGATDREVDGVVEAARGAYDTGVSTARLQALIAPAITVTTQGSFLAVLGIGGARVASGAITVAALVSFVLYLFLLILPLTRLAQLDTTADRARSAGPHRGAAADTRRERARSRTRYRDIARRPGSGATRGRLRLRRQRRRAHAGAARGQPHGRTGLADGARRTIRGGQVDDPGFGGALLRRRRGGRARRWGRRAGAPA